MNWLVSHGYLAPTPLGQLGQGMTIVVWVMIILDVLKGYSPYPGLDVVSPPAYLPRHSRRR